MAVVNWSDLQTRGFVIVPRWLTPRKVEWLCEDYAQQPVADNKNYSVKFVSATVARLLSRACEAAARQVAHHTDTQADIVSAGVYFSISAGINLSWHQDHEMYYVSQHHHYLNFWVPIIKPERDKGNLRILPFDTLRTVAPEWCQHVIGSGASVLGCHEGAWQWRSDVTGQTEPVPFNPEDVAFTPALQAGDLLLMRGDMFHRTQDTDTDRVAVSMRMESSAGHVSRWTLATLCPNKLILMAKNSRLYRQAFLAYALSGQDEMPMAQYARMLSSASSVPNPDSPTLANLLAQALTRNDNAYRLTMKRMADCVRFLEKARQRNGRAALEREDEAMLLDVQRCVQKIEDFSSSRPELPELELWLEALQRALPRLV